MLLVGLVVIFSVVVWDPPALERAGINACSRMRNQGQKVQQRCSSLDHAFTVQILPTQALPENKKDCLKNKFEVFLEVLGLFDCFPGFYAYKSHSGQFFNLFSARQKPRNVLS